MYCIHCGKEIPDDSTFCTACGEPAVSLSEAENEVGGQPYAPSAAAPLPPEAAQVPEPKKPLGALAITGFVFAAISFVAGFILLTMALCGSPAAFDLYYILPAFAGLAMCIFAVKKPEENGRALSIAGIALASVMLLYYLISAFVLSGMAI